MQLGMLAQLWRRSLNSSLHTWYHCAGVASSLRPIYMRSTDWLSSFTS